ncbi:MAG: hypothetical protein EOM54_05715, partial [Clostridia bacterium]|nr:hypothetical protein [Clostridia bacterium]
QLIMEIMAVTPTAANWEAYVSILHDEELLKRLQTAAFEIIDAGNLEDARKAAEKASALLADRRDLRIVPFSRGLAEFYERQTSKKSPDYLNWGFKQLDEMLSVEAGDFIVLGGYPSSGKTLLAGQFALHMAPDKRIGIFSLETKDQKLYDRMISFAARISFDDVKRQSLAEADIEKVIELGKVSEAIKLDVINAVGMSVADIRAIALAKHYDVIFIDYLQLIRAEGKDRYEKVTNISLALHELAGATGLAVVALAQLSRPDKRKKNEPPTMSSLRESGQIEQDAEAIMLLYLDDEDMPDGDRILKVEKNKQGKRGFFRLGFYPKHICFYQKSKVYDFQNKPTSKFKPITGEDSQTALPF